jgi:CheY-like chemotaxis protein
MSVPLHRLTSACAGRLAILLLAIYWPSIAFCQDPPPDAGDVAEAPAAAPLPPVDPAVRAILQSDPTDPAQIVRVITVLADLGAADQAGPFVQRLVDANLDEAAQARLVEQLGSATFIKLSLSGQLPAAGRQFAAGALAAADRQARDPARIAALIERLKNPDPRARQAAMARLRTGRDSSVAALIEVLADPARAAEHGPVRQALAGQDVEAFLPLVAVIQASPPELRWQALDVLARLDRPEATIWLLSPALSPESSEAVRSAAAAGVVRLIGRLPRPAEATAALYNRALAYRHLERPLTVNAAGLAKVWHWNDAQRRLESRDVAPRMASLTYAADLAANALELQPGQIELRRLLLGARLESEAYMAGLGQPLPRGIHSAFELATRAGPDAVEDLLAHSIEAGHPVSAAAAATVLGEIGSADLLDRGGARPAALVQAVRHPDRRLRFSALEAILRLKPVRPYPGSSYVTDSLGFFAASSGRPRALVADARPGELQFPSGLLAELGYEVEATTSARQVLAIAASSPDFEVALIDMTLASPTSAQLVQQLRKDNRTARLPVGILASSDQWERARELVRDLPLADVFIRPQDTRAMEYQLAGLFEATGASAVPAAERQAQAARALEWLVELSAPSGLYNLRRVEASVATAVWAPPLAPRAAEVLAAIGTPLSQKTLVDVASQALQPLESRQAAARAFAESVARHGTLLTSGEILLQYDRYNQSETQDRQTQLVLASILDSVEARAAAEQTE